MTSYQALRAAIRRVTIASSALALSTLVASAVQAQSSQHVPTGVFSGGLAFAVSDPRGDFGKNTGNGYGVDVSGIWRLEEQGILNLRFEGSFLGYASSTRRIPLIGSGSLLKLDLKTSSNIFTLVGGPQLLGTKGPFTPYVTALGGFSYFGTTTSVEGSDNSNEDFASTTNSSDASLAYGGGAGIVARIYKSGNTDVKLEFGARYLRHDNAKYLNDQRVQEGFENNRDPIPLKGRADFMTYFIGFNAVLW
ncbi:MAG: hypothetical protein ABI852_01105 [Gemmatimonadaceae bacterium]